jgi:predicted phage replisome organizer
MTEDKFYWIKLRTNFYRKKEIDYLLSLEEGASYVVIYIQLCFSTANNGGRLEERIGEITIPYTTKKIALDLKYFSEDIIDKALTLFKQLGLICEEDGILKVVDFGKMVGSESASKSAINKRNQREKAKEKDKNEDNVQDNKKDNAVDIKEDKKRTKCPIEYRDKSIEYKSIDIKEKEINKEKEKTAAANNTQNTIYDLLTESFGRTFNTIEAEHINSWEDNELTRYAIKSAVLSGAYSLKYIDSILRRYKTENIKTVEEAKESEKRFKNKSKNYVNEESKEWI